MTHDEARNIDLTYRKHRCHQPVTIDTYDRYVGSRITLGNLTIDRDRFEVLIDDRRVELTYVEFELLHQLARHAGKVVPRFRLLQTVWGDRQPGADRTLTVHMSRMRSKLRDSHPWQIETTTKRGYAFANSARPQDHSGSGTGRVAAVLAAAKPDTAESRPPP
jgi:DNA-binding response OmpR family regulator